MHFLWHKAGFLNVKPGLFEMLIASRVLGDCMGGLWDSHYMSFYWM